MRDRFLPVMTFCLALAGSIWFYAEYRAQGFRFTLGSPADRLPGVLAGLIVAWGAVIYSGLYGRRGR